ncbi:hypothetical protein J422_00551 [Methanocaldococcus villosus KIN24-T80]|uniref:MrpA C-terminal/MbhD domain-containing protein n=1 Tax=Methanocaldococcus villosus KIN24-T80 TaxID=1069083 RepID=N6VU87_9EURY|nr:DUF2108 domain-containing protein [Methanocaldococcus villosus]ENN96761.1 hypothetical protein J422_00551 [Methanocaldococcus villosus KIN24-T80]
MIEYIASLCCVLGAIGVIFYKNPINKIILLSLIEIGVILFIVYYYYLDIALITSLTEPICTVILLIGYMKYLSMVKSKKKYGRELPILTK